MISVEQNTKKKWKTNTFVCEHDDNQKSNCARAQIKCIDEINRKISLLKLQTDKAQFISSKVPPSSFLNATHFYCLHSLYNIQEFNFLTHFFLPILFIGSFKIERYWNCSWHISTKSQKQTIQIKSTKSKKCRRVIWKQLKLARILPSHGVIWVVCSTHKAKYGWRFIISKRRSHWIQTSSMHILIWATFWRKLASLIGELNGFFFFFI